MVYFHRNDTKHAVPEDIAGLLLTSALAALTDARDGIKLEKSNAYHQLQNQMSTHVYQPKAPPQQMEKGKDPVGDALAEHIAAFRRAHPDITIWWDEAANFDEAAWARFSERNLQQIQITMSGRQGGKTLWYKINAARRAFKAMTANMNEYSAITRLSERFNEPYETIREWVK